MNDCYFFSCFYPIKILFSNKLKINNIYKIIKEY